VTLAFAVAMTLIVGALALFLYQRLERSLAHSVDQGLQARAVDVASMASQTDNGLSSARDPLSGENFGQLIDGRGRVFDATPGLGKRPLLTTVQLARAHQGAYFLELGSLREGPARVFVEPIGAQDQSLVLLVGSSLSDERSALGGLRRALLIGGPIALLLTSIGGYLLAGAALRPVERMRARAAGMSAASRDHKLPVPPGGDEIARLGHTLNELLERLAHARDRERQFVADASHELRTPLSLLKAEVELALDGPRSARELREALQSAGEETDRLVQLAEDLLLLAQADSGVLPVRIGSIEASHLADRIVARFAPRASRANRRIETDVPAGLTLHLDPLRIEQALGNLIDNALRHGAGTITLQILASGERVELRVRDQGDGLPAEFRAHAFERFARHDSSRHSHGTGLGLAIVAAIADAHRGQLTIGPGAEIILRLPALTDASTQPQAPQPVAGKPTWHEVAPF
jgi:signal transduction histidine kinase